MNILLLGCGYWGSRWYKTILNSQYELAGVVDPQPYVPIKDTVLFPNLASVDISFTHVVIATPVETHESLYKVLIEHGIDPSNILIEKPCGLSYIDPQNSVKDCYYPGFIFLHDPIYDLIKLDLKNLGDILSYRSFRASMGPRIRTDVSIIEDYLIHDLYLFLDLFGDDNLRIIKNYLRTDVFDDPIQASEIDLSMKKNDMSIHMFSSWWYPEKSREIVIIGTEGSIIWRNDILTVIDSYYKKQNGFDNFRNIGYRLELDTQPSITDFSKKFSIRNSNLSLELNSFMEKKRDLAELLRKTWILIERLKNELE